MKNLNKQGVSIKTIVSTIALALVLINNVLVSAGVNVFGDVTYDTSVKVVSNVATIAVAGWNWWHNNSFTKPAQVADYVMKKLKTNELVIDEDGNLKIKED